MADYIVSARKYRPDSFDTLIGQDNIARTLKNSILRGQLAHAYLFCGPRGVGKTSAARIFAKTINCANPGPDMEPCGECESCRSFREGRSYCIHELDAASNNGVDDIKTLMDQVLIPPQVGRYSVYIIDEVHMLSQAAFNAFLKTLEEPPAHAIFILATTEKHKILPTILSRCQTYDFNRIGIPDIVRNLRSIAAREQVQIDDRSLHVIARKADGAMRDALTIFDQTVAFCGTDVRYEDVSRNLNELDCEYSFSLVDAFLAGRYGDALLTFDEILRKGFNDLHFIGALGAHLRDLLVCRTGGLDALLDLPDSLKERYTQQAARCSVKFLYEALGVISQCEAGYKAATSQRLHIEFALMRLCFLQNQPDASAVSAPAPAPAAMKTTPAAVPTTATAPQSAEPEIPVPLQEAVPTERTVPQAEAAPEKPAEKPAETPAAPPTAPAGEPKQTARKAPGLSLASLMQEAEPLVMPAPDTLQQDTGGATALSLETVQTAWTTLSEHYASKPRLANTLKESRLEIQVGEGPAQVQFYLTNEAQKTWIERNILRDLEARLQERLGGRQVRLVPVVLPEEAGKEEKKYMPSEQARDLMEKNEEVRKLVIDLGLDIK